MIVDLQPKIQIELVVRDTDVDNLITDIIDSVRTGKISDDRIFILPGEKSIMIKPGGDRIIKKYKVKPIFSIFIQENPITKTKFLEGLGSKPSNLHRPVLPVL